MLKAFYGSKIPKVGGTISRGSLRGAENPAPLPVVKWISILYLTMAANSNKKTGKTDETAKHFLFPVKLPHYITLALIFINGGYVLVEPL
jgi:hypothetical protein